MGEFFVPVYTEDLEVVQSARFYVKAVLDVESIDDIGATLDGVGDALAKAETVCTGIVDNAIFDPLYSLVKYWTILTPKIQERLIETLAGAMNDLLVELQNPANVSAAVPAARDAQRLAGIMRNGFKALVYLFGVAVQVAEKTCTVKAATVKTKAGSAGDADDGTADAADDDGGARGDPSSEAFDWQSCRRDCVALLVKACFVDCRRLWAMGLPEEEFTSALLKTAQRLALAPAAMKDKAARPLVVQLLALAVARFPGLLASAASALVGGILMHDHVGEAALEAVTLWTAPAPAEGTGTSAAAASAASCHCPTAAAEVLRELGRVNGGGDGTANASAAGAAARAAVKDTAGLRRAATFLAAVSERQPRLVLANVSVLLPYLDCDSSTLRSALLSALAGILVKATAAMRAVAAAGAGGGGGIVAGGAASELADAVAMARLMTPRVRDTLLETLAERCYDAHALTRAAVLKAWTAIVVSGAIPLDRLQALTALAAERARDRGAQVRRAAAALLRSLLEYNPFGPALAPALFEAQAQAAELWLAGHAPHLLPGAGPAPAAAAAAVEDAADKQSEEAGSELVGVAAAVAEGSEATASVDGGEAQGAAAAGAASSAAAASAADVSPEAARQVQLRAGCLAATAFSRAMQDTVPAMADMLQSKTGSDAQGAIRFLAKARAFGVAGAEAALARMLVLVWSPGAGVREEVVTTFDKLYVLNEALDEGGAEGDGDGADDDGEGAGAAEGAAADEGEAAAAAAAAPSAVRPKRAAKAPAAKKGKTKGKAAAGSDSDDSDGDADNVDADDEEADAEARGGKAAKKGKQRAAPKHPRTKRGKAAAASGALAEDHAEARAAAAASAAAGAATAGRGKGSAALSAAEAAARCDTVDAVAVADNLVALLRGATLAVRASLEAVLGELSARGMLPPTVPRVLWELVAAGTAAHQRLRVQIGATVAAVRTAAGLHVAAGSSAGAAAVAPATAAAAARGASHVRAVVSHAEAAIQRGRCAMALLGMLAGAAGSAAGPGSLSSLAGLGRLEAALQPAAAEGGGSAAGLPVGLAFLREAAGVLLPLPAGEAPSAAAAAAAPTLAAVASGMCACDYRLAAYACAALQKVRGETLLPPRKQAAVAAAAAPAAATVPTAGRGAAGGGKVAAAAAAAAAAEAADAERQSGLRHAALQRLLSGVCDMVAGAWDGGDVDNEHWFPAAQAGLDAVFALCPFPEETARRVLLRMLHGCGCDGGGGATEPATALRLSVPRLSRLCFALGHAGLRALVHADSLALRAKTLRVLSAEKGDRDRAAAATAKPGPGGGVGKKAGAAEAGSLEDQLGATAAEDEKEAELLVAVAERELAGRSMLTAFVPLMAGIVRTHLLHMPPLAAAPAAADASGADAAADAAAAPPATAATSAVSRDKAAAMAHSALLALCKLMALSPDLCERHMTLLFTVLSRCPAPAVRSTVATALGDLTHRFPNLVEPYAAHLYARLRDPEPAVRRNALLVLTHLILNGMIKIKGQIGEVAVCLTDEQPRIVQLARSFFAELSKRGNSPIYNILPDTLSCLSKLAAQSGGAASSLQQRPFTTASFQTVIRFLLGFIGKDRQAEGLADKLLHRFEAVDEPTTWRDVAFCLSQLPLNDRVVRRLAEALPLYRRALTDEDVWGHMQATLARAKRVAPGGSGGAAGKSGKIKAVKAAAAAGDDAGGGPDEAADITASETGGGGGASSLSKGELREVVAEWERLLAEARAGVAEDSAADAQARAVARRAAALAVADGVAGDLDAQTAAITAAAVAAAAAAVAPAAVAGGRKRGASQAVAAPGTAAAAGKAKAKPKPRKAAKPTASDGEDDDDGDDSEAEAHGGASASSRGGAGGGGKRAVPAPHRKKGMVASDSEDEDAVDAPPPRSGKASSSAARATKPAAAAPLASLKPNARGK